MSAIIAQINNAPIRFKRTGWAIASDEHEAGKINRQIAAVAAVDEIVVDYPGEDFYAYIWHDGDWFGEIWKNHMQIGLEMASTIDALISKIRGKFGLQ